MRIVVDVNDEDYIAFNIAHQFKGTEGAKNVRNFKTLFKAGLVISVILMIFVILETVLLNKFKFSDLSVALVLAIYCIVILATFESRTKKRIRKKVEKYRKSGEHMYDSEATFDLTDEMIMEYTPKSTTRREWSDIKSIIMDEGHYYLMLGPMQGLIIPFRCLGDEMNTFLPYVQQKTGLEVIR